MTKLKSILAIAFFSITTIASAQTADDRSLFDVTGNVKSITSKSDTGPLRAQAEFPVNGFFEKC